ncbi:MAG TPA: SIMPL domain-containing protein [Casimicrobiaceae bacterium]|nr:SIMPL domain-containing protein [Casimicrobiaceae bacterium]
MIRPPRAAVLALSIFAAGVAAQPLQPPPFYNVVTLEASATADVPADTLTATLFTEEQGSDPGQLAAKVNARIEEALAKAKSEPKVEARSGNYQTTPVYDRGNQITGWRIRADIVLESRDFKALSALAGQLQPTLKLWSMTFSLSRRARESAEATLTGEALARFQEKARAIAKALGFPGHSLGQISIRTEGPVQAVPMFRTAAVGVAEGTPPAGPVPVEPGKGTVSVFVSGSVILGPPK